METRPEALILASYTYEDPEIEQLMAPSQDAADLARVLEDPNIGGFLVKKRINMPHHEVNQAIEGFFNKDRKREDMLLLYFSGHGIKDEDGQLYLTFPDTRRDALRSTGISSKWIFEILELCRSRRLVLILDCCYSGAFPLGKAHKGDRTIETKKLFGGKGRVILSASDEMQYAFEGDTVEGKGKQSIFTRTLIHGLESGEADRNRTGYVYVEDLYEYVKDKIHDEIPEMKPGFWIDPDYEYGDMIIAKSLFKPTKPITEPRPLLRRCLNPNCGSMLRPRAEFCHICGIAAMTDANRGKQRCPNCGYPKRQTASFCPHCGNRL
jgi:hypothetical protein